MLSLNKLQQGNKRNNWEVLSKFAIAVTSNMTEININSSCRVCLIQQLPSDLFWLFGTNSIFEDISIAKALSDCFNISLKQESNLPQYVCKTCAANTLQAYTFKNCILKCQKHLHAVQNFAKLKNSKHGNQSLTDDEQQLILKFEESREDFHLEEDSSDSIKIIHLNSPINRRQNNEDVHLKKDSNGSVKSIIQTSRNKEHQETLILAKNINFHLEEDSNNESTQISTDDELQEVLMLEENTEDFHLEEDSNDSMKSFHQKEIDDEQEVTLMLEKNKEGFHLVEDSNESLRGIHQILTDDEQETLMLDENQEDFYLEEDSNDSMKSMYQKEAENQQEETLMVEKSNQDFHLEENYNDSIKIIHQNSTVNEEQEILMIVESNEDFYLEDSKDSVTIIHQISTEDQQRKTLMFEQRKDFQFNDEFNKFIHMINPLSEHDYTKEIKIESEEILLDPNTDKQPELLGVADELTLNEYASDDIYVDQQPELLEVINNDLTRNEYSSDDTSSFDSNYSSDISSNVEQIPFPMLVAMSEDQTVNEVEAAIEEQPVGKVDIFETSSVEETSDKWWLRINKPPYICRICGQNYSAKYKTFYKHLLEHQKKKHPCVKCGKMLVEEEMAEHTCLHTNEKSYICDKCPVRFKSMGNLQRHLKTHSGDKPYICDRCPTRFTSSGNLQRHIKTHNGERPYICDICGKAFTQLSSLNTHMELHENNTYICEYCGYICNSKIKHRLHLNKLHKKKSNVEKTDSSNVRPFSCNECFRTFKTTSGLFIHSQVHRDHDKYDCNSCGQIFFSYYNLNVHTLWHKVKNEPPIDLTYRCELCTLQFTNKYDLEVHILTHMEKNFTCNVCDKCFLLKTSLANHMRQFHTTKPYVCSICDKSFRTPAFLKQHIHVHTGEKPFECEVCKRKFTQRQQLVTHKLTHTGEKKYVCPYCGKAFALNGNLTVHKRRHTGETPYSCQICYKGFYDSSSLKKHKLAHKHISVLETNQNSQRVQVEFEEVGLNEYASHVL